jgi:hypothetical protein
MVSRSSVSCSKINIADYRLPGCADSSNFLVLNAVDLPPSLLDAPRFDEESKTSSSQVRSTPIIITRADSRVLKPIAGDSPRSSVPSKKFLGKLPPLPQNTLRFDFIESLLPNKQTSPVKLSGEYINNQMNYKYSNIVKYRLITNHYRSFKSTNTTRDPRLVSPNNIRDNKSPSANSISSSIIIRTIRESGYT